jgi:iron complex outermembrane receptor protein
MNIKAKISIAARKAEQQIYLPVLLAIATVHGQASAQRADENVVTAATDAFGTSIGDEDIGLYNPDDVRGFSPAIAGNLRLEGLYFSPSPRPNKRIFQGSDIHVGISSLGYPFPAPTGIVDFHLRPAGPTPILAIVASLGPMGSQQFSLDGQLPISPTLSIAGGVAYRRTVDQPGGDEGRGVTIGIAPAWRPAPGIEIRPFWSRSYVIDDITTPYIFVDGHHLPPQIKQQSYAQRWTGWNGSHDEYGVLGTIPIGPWQLRIGAFDTISHFSTSYSDLYLQTGANGLAQQHIINIEAPRGSRTRSGEIRLSRQIQTRKFRHDFYLSARALFQKRHYGGGDSVDFGEAQIGEFVNLPEPEILFNDQNQERVRNWAGGLGYVGRWAGVGELSFGIQKMQYYRRSETPAHPTLITRTNPWLWNGTVAVFLTSRLTFYGGYTRGLEGSSDAPEIATNRNEAPPAILTEQHDIGLRYAITPKLRLVWGLFEVRKPYFNLDQELHYGEIGKTRYQGMEISLTGEMAKGLNLVAGAVLMRPRVSGEAVNDGLIGPKPVGQPTHIFKADLDYRPAGTSPFSVDLSLAYFGEVTASQDNKLTIPPAMFVDAGARYRFKMTGKSTTLRLLVENITNSFSWSVNPSGGFRPKPQRRFSASLAVDF